MKNLKSRVMTPKLSKSTPEEWRKVAQLAWWNEVSNKGRVRTIPRKRRHSDGTIRHYRGQIRKLTSRKDHYLQVRLVGKSGRTKNYLVHRLVAQAFLPNPQNKPEVNHKDNDPRNNQLENLEWTTTKENIIHAHANGFVHNAQGENHPSHKLTENLVLKMRDWFAKQGLSFLEIRRRLIRSKGITVAPNAVRSAVLGKTWKHLKRN